MSLWQRLVMKGWDVASRFMVSSNLQILWPDKWIVQWWKNIERNCHFSCTLPRADHSFLRMVVQKSAPSAFGMPSAIDLLEGLDVNRWQFKQNVLEHFPEPKKGKNKQNLNQGTYVGCNFKICPDWRIRLWSSHTHVMYSYHSTDSTAIANVTNKQILERDEKQWKVIVYLWQLSKTTWTFIVPTSIESSIPQPC